MKLIIIFTSFILLSCEFPDSSQEIVTRYANTYIDDIYINDVHYIVFNRYRDGVYLVNYTKDSLEIERLKGE